MLTYFKLFSSCVPKFFVICCISDYLRAFFFDSYFFFTLYILAPIYPTPIDAVRKFDDKIIKTAKVLKIHSVIFLDLFSQLHILFNSLHVANNNYFNGNFWFNALDMHTFMLSGSRSVRNGIPFSDSRHFRS